MRSSLPVCFLSALLIGQCAWANSADQTQPYIGAASSYLWANDVRSAEAEEAGAQLWMGFPLSAYPGWAAEVSGAWNPVTRDDGTGDDQLYQFGVDLQRLWRSNASWQPYVLAGLAWAYEEIRDEEASRASLALGGGVLWQSPVPQLKLRFDARALAQENDYQFNGQDVSGRRILVDGRFAAGLQWSAWPGRNEEVKTVQGGDDQDQDGVPNKEDLCPGSRPAAQVDATGCQLAIALDSDGDGVSNAQDQCPGTVREAQVDPVGCSVDDAVELKGVNFALNSDQLTADASVILDQAAFLLKGSLRDLRIEIAGHTDNQGEEDYNQALSARRAYAVKSYLVQQGVSAGRLVSTGYGDSQPVASNDSEENRAANRRVVFKIIND